eukprot:3940364-Rhodomonas_salina.1
MVLRPCYALSDTGLAYDAMELLWEARTELGYDTAKLLRERPVPPVLSARMALGCVERGPARPLSYGMRY